MALAGRLNAYADLLLSGRTALRACAPFEFDLFATHAPTFSPSLQPSPHWPQSHNPPVRVRLATDPHNHIQPRQIACQPSSLKAARLTLPCLTQPCAAPLVSRHAASSRYLLPFCSTSRAAAARSTHTRSTQASRVGLPSTAIHAACSRVVVGVARYSKIAKPSLQLLLLPAAVRHSVPPPQRTSSPAVLPPRDNCPPRRRLSTSASAQKSLAAHTLALALCR